jgi:uncharacterized protein
MTFALHKPDQQGANAMPDISRQPDQVAEVLRNAQVIAIVGMSNDHYYSSYEVGQYLKAQGYTVYPVNPTISDVDGQKAYASLKDIPARIDIVNVFRNSAYLPEVVEDAIAVHARVLWTQLGVVDMDRTSLPRAIQAGMDVVENVCIRTIHEQIMASTT